MEDRSSFAGDTKLRRTRGRNFSEGHEVNGDRTSGRGILVLRGGSPDIIYGHITHVPVECLQPLQGNPSGMAIHITNVDAAGKRLSVDRPRALQTVSRDGNPTQRGVNIAQEQVGSRSV